MSINVTVHGNPISIRRGKMVAIDADKEFELRRKIRLQQVRQQSKEIAEDVRNRVRREKNKQLSKIEKKAERDLTKLQERKLSSLQKQYEDCLEEFGAAYKDAEVQIDPHEIIERVQEKNRNQAELRGKTATEKQKEDKEQQDKKTKQYLENKRDVRNIENLRSKLVSSLHKNKQSPFKNKRRKKCVTDIHINGVATVLSDGSDVNSDIENLSVLDELSPNVDRSLSKGSLDSQGNSIYSDIDSTKENDRSQDLLQNSTQQPVLETLWDRADQKSNSNHKDKQTIYTQRSKTTNYDAGDRKQFETITEEHNPSSYQEYDDITRRRKLKNIQAPKSNIHENEYTNFEYVREYPHRDFPKSNKSDDEQFVDQYNDKYRQKSPRSYNEKDSFHRTKQRASHISDRIQKALAKHNRISPNRSISPDQLKHENKIDDYHKYKTRLQSGLDTDEKNPYCCCDEPCDETNCPVLLSEAPPMKSKIRITKSPKKSPKKSNNPSSKSIYRKTIRSAKTPQNHTTETTNTTEKLDIHEYDQDNMKIKSPTKCIWPDGPSCRKVSPKKVKCKSPTIVCPRAKEFNLPYVPTTTVLPETVDSQDSTVRYYDRFNRFSKETHQPTLVQKISEDSIQVCPSTDEDEKYRNRVRRRDLEARIRGNKALEKNKIHRDYQQLMEDLPILQRKERLSSMNTHNPTLHMSDERYKEYERQKQNHMENVFENMQMKSNSLDTPIITLKSVRKSPPSSDMKQPFKTLDVSEENSIPVLNVGRWENVESAISSTTQVSPEETPTDESVDKEQALAELLKRVNKQREILLKEAANLPSLINLKSVLNEEELLELIGKKREPQTKILVETSTSPLVTKVSKKTIRSPSSKASSKRNVVTSSSETSIGTPKHKKKSKIHKKMKVLIKEEGTQTTPSVDKINQCITKSVSQNVKREEATQTSPCCPNAGGRLCLCPKHKCPPSQDTYDYITESNNGVSNSSSDKLCEIIIKTRDDSNVQISQHTTPRGNATKSTEEFRKIPKQQSVVKIKVKDQDFPKKLLEMSTSTSYMSPPIEAPVQEKSTINNKPSNKDLLQPQKQQTNIDQFVRVENGSKEVNPRLIKYIKRLLTMSRQSIDELTISSVSDISTPHESIVNTSTNMAREKLQTVMDHFNLSIEDIKNYYLSTSSFSVSDVTSETAQNQTEPYLHFTEHKISHSDPVKKYTSVSTSTDPICAPPSPRSPKLSSGTTATEENERFVNEYKKYEEYQRSQVTSPQRSTQQSTSEGNKIPEASVSTDTGQNIQNRSRSQSPKPAREIIEKEKYEFVIDEPKRIISGLISEERYTYPSVSTEHKGLPEGERRDLSPGRISLSQKEQSSKIVGSILRKSPSPKKSPPPKPPSVTPERPQSPNQLKESPTKIIRSKSSTQKDSPDQKSLPYDTEFLQQPQNFLQFVRESLGMSVEEFSELGFQDMFARHMQLTEYCHDRIKSLMDLIEKVRNDKRQIYTPSPVDQSMTLTSYLELPKVHDESRLSPEAKEFYDSIKREVDNENSAGTGSSISQGAMDEYLLGVNQEQIPPKILKKQAAYKEQVHEENVVTNPEVEDNFVPMLQGIPKYTEDNKTHPSKYIKEIIQHLKARPPPSLLRSNMRGQTDVIPHELSTIVEAETLVSSRNTSLQVPQSPDKHIVSQQEQNCTCGDKKPVQDTNLEVTYLSPEISENTGFASDSGDYITISPEKSISSKKQSIKNVVIQKIQSTSTSNGEDLHEKIVVQKIITPRNNINTSTTSSQDDLRVKSSLSGVQPLSESTSDSPDELESMLRKFKLEWAISLVRKTEQALALSSSSSASDIIHPKPLFPDNSSDLSVRETYKRICQQIASSSGSETERSQMFLDLSQHFKDFHDISEIPGVAEKNKSQQRTSTPVHYSKSSESKKSLSKESLFRIDSELSSVRNSSEDNLFLSIPNVTLNTTHCSLNKRKK